MSIVIALVIGAVTGVLSGCGIGGGSLLILYLTAVAGIEQYAAGGVNLLYFMCCAPTALVSHIRNRRIEWRAVLWCTLCGAVTSLTAAYVASLVSVKLLRRLFGILLLYVGVREVCCKAEK